MLGVSSSSSSSSSRQHARAHTSLMTFTEDTTCLSVCHQFSFLSVDRGQLKERKANNLLGWSMKANGFITLAKGWNLARPFLPNHTHLTVHFHDASFTLMITRNWGEKRGKKRLKKQFNSELLLESFMADAEAVMLATMAKPKRVLLFIIQHFLPFYLQLIPSFVPFYLLYSIFIFWIMDWQLLNAINKY